MIVLDADLLVIDLRYPSDARYAMNRQVLDALHLGNERVAITCHTLLEVVGVVSFSASASVVATLPMKIPAWYAVEVLPDPQVNPVYADCGVADLINRMTHRCSLGDGVTMEQIERFIPHASFLLSWNARHFQGRLAVPAITPEEWWQKHVPR